MPKGSVLGPILFIIYTNDLPLHTDVQTDMFADDTTISSCGKHPEDIVQILDNNLVKVRRWCEHNGMLINTDKTKAMFLATKQKSQILSDRIPNIKIDDRELENVDSEKLLGVHIDQSLTWNEQINNVHKKINSLLYLLCRIKSYLSIPIRKMFYNSYILPHLDYCCTVCGNCNAELMSKLQNFQKKERQE